MKGTSALEISSLVTVRVSAVELPLSLTFRVFEPAAATTLSVPASPARLPVLVGALLETLTVSPAAVVIFVVAKVLCTLTVSAAVPVSRLMPPPNVPVVE